MHIPDGFLSLPVALVLWALSALAIGYALKRVGSELDERKVPLMGVLAAAIFAGQMLNFTVIGGTSGHLMGAAIATILLGPWTALLVMATVVGVQALVFQDGGLLALGANLFNMGVIGVAVSHFVFRAIRHFTHGKSISKTGGQLGAGFLAGWASIEITALAVGLQLALSGASPANLAIPAMAGVHALIGLGEGLITLAALAVIRSARADLLEVTSARPRSETPVWVAGLILALLLAVASPLASTHPDGLEKASESLGLIQTARQPAYTLIPDYLFPGVSNQAVATILAGLLGAAIVLVAALAIALSRRKRQKEKRG